MTTDQRSLTIAVLTYRRPRDLAEVVPLLIEQARSVGPAVVARVLVVDNDPVASARKSIDAATAYSEVRAGAADPIRLVYAHEPEPGIAAARNRALVESAGSDLLVFIDDDERPREDWLSELLRVQRATGARAVAGPVVSEYSVTPDPWIVAGRFFVRRRLADGAGIEVAATNNLLIDLGWTREQGLRFDPAFGISGGEDTLFTRGIAERGGRMVWAAGAVVTDVVPPERLTRAWVLRRAFSSGNSWSTTAIRSAGGGVRPALRAALTAKGVARLVGGAAGVGLGVASRSMARRARGCRTVYRGAGMVTGAWGYGFLEYRRDA